MDDVAIIVTNPLVAEPAGVWRAFGAPYWPPDLGGHLYRPLIIAAFALDRMLDGAVWFHAANLLWHGAAAVAVAVLARRWADTTGGLVAGVFVVLSVYAALAREAIGWSAAAWALGLLCKENAAVAPALIAWAWVLGLARPSRRRMGLFVASWVLVGGVYAVARAVVLHPFAGFQSIGAMFLGASPWAVRLTAVSALADVARLLVFPLTLRVDYSPNERSLVTSPLDPGFVVGALCALLWSALLALAWKRDRKLEAFGLGWIGVALLPVANVLYPAGFYVAERTLYLPSAGLVLAAAGWVARPPRERLWPVVAALAVLAGIRTALRVPVWRDDTSVTLSIITDSPRSYVGPKRMIGYYLDQHAPARALAAARIAAATYGRDPTIYATGSVAAFAVGDSRAADSLLAALEQLCHRCGGYYRREATVARAHGYAAAADSLLARSPGAP